MRKVGKDFWENIFRYPSFNLRFGSVVIVILVLFLIVVYFLYSLFSTTTDKLTFLNLILQSATLVLGILAAYYALRQLIETRLVTLNDSGMSDLKNGHYLSAIKKWKESFYIKPDFRVFTNFVEVFLILEDFDAFDYHIQVLQPHGFIRTNIAEDSSDQITLLYLRSLRHLLIENLGEAKKVLNELIEQTKSPERLTRFQWDFSDIQSAGKYRSLTGDCRIITDNLILYLQKTMKEKRKQEFESGKFTSQIEN